MQSYKKHFKMHAKHLILEFTIKLTHVQPSLNTKSFLVKISVYIADPEKKFKYSLYLCFIHLQSKPATCIYFKAALSLPMYNIKQHMFLTMSHENQ